MGCGGSSANTAASNDGSNPEQQTRGLPKKNIKPDWAELSKKLPRTKSAEDTEARKKLFSQFDPNGNGYLSLAEVDKGCRDIGLERLTDDLAPILIRAFNQAKDAASKHGAGSDNKDYVEANEFRLLLVYIYNYFEMWIAFDDVDSSDDRRVTLAEFKKAVPKLAEWGVQVNDADAEFKQIDVNGGGYVLFQEFADWCFKKHVDVDHKQNVE